MNNDHLTSHLVVAFVCAFLVAGCSGQPERTWDETIECRSPNGKRDTKTIKRWKYDRIRTEILKALPEDNDAGLPFPELVQAVTDTFTQEDQMQIGNVKWHIESVALEMETTEEISRFPDTDTPLPKNVRRAE